MRSPKTSRECNPAKNSAVFPSATLTFYNQYGRVDTLFLYRAHIQFSYAWEVRWFDASWFVTRCEWRHVYRHRHVVAPSACARACSPPARPAVWRRTADQWPCRSISFPPFTHRTCERANRNTPTGIRTSCLCEKGFFYLFKCFQIRFVIMLLRRLLWQGNDLEF